MITRLQRASHLDLLLGCCHHLLCMAAQSVVCVCVQVSEAAHVHTHSSGQKQRHGCCEWGEQWGPGAVAHSVPSPVCPTDPGDLHRCTQSHLPICKKIGSLLCNIATVCMLAIAAPGHTTCGYPLGESEHLGLSIACQMQVLSKLFFNPKLKAFTPRRPLQITVCQAGCFWQYAASKS